MGMMDDMKDKVTDNMSGMQDSARERYEMLKSQAQSGELDDSAREELNQLRSRFERNDSGE